MNGNKWWSFTVFLLCFSISSFAQDARPGVAKHERQIREMVAFLEYMLNTLGDGQTPMADKDVLVTESYSKIFRDAKVQIEDDLDENRKVITNKDVQAYLKDVDFFFKTAKFELNIESIQPVGSSSHQEAFRVSLKRNLKGTTIEGKTVNKTIPRFIEINYNLKSQDLKIVSIYTQEFNEKQALTGWWNQLSLEWQSIFKRKLNFRQDTLSLEDIKVVTTIENLDLSKNKYILNIEPLAQLTSLRRLNLANTRINNLTPIRNLTELIDLDISNTSVDDISTLRYASNLARLRARHTLIKDISVLEKLASLEVVDLERNLIDDFSPIAYLHDLKYLNVSNTNVDQLDFMDSLQLVTELYASNTRIGDVSPLQGLSRISVLYLDSTAIKSIEPLRQLQNLRVLSINNTTVASLAPLSTLARIDRIYCDDSRINEEEANAFMKSNPKVLVIYASENLQEWWSALPGPWQQVLSKAARTRTNPSKEELAKVTSLDSIYIVQNTGITDLRPLQKLLKLKTLVIFQSPVTDLSPISYHTDLQHLDISETKVTDLSPLVSLYNLSVLKADHLQIDNIDTLSHLKSLQRIYIDNTNVTEEKVFDFLQKNRNCLIVFKTAALELWWNSLSEEWKQVFHGQESMGARSIKEYLHRLIESEKVEFADAKIRELSALAPFMQLRELRFSGTQVNDVTPLGKHKLLSVLHMPDNPVYNVSVFSQLVELRDINISNTPVNDLSSFSRLSKLERLVCSGTRIKKITGLKDVSSLTYLDVSNTNVNKLKPVFGAPLKTVRCYNTEIKSSEVAKFRSRHPECEVVYY